MKNMGLHTKRTEQLIKYFMINIAITEHLELEGWEEEVLNANWRDLSKQIVDSVEGVNSGSNLIVDMY